MSSAPFWPTTGQRIYVEWRYLVSRFGTYGTVQRLAGIGMLATVVGILAVLLVVMIAKVSIPR